MEHTKRPILITGSSGLIGRSLTEALREAGETVIEMDIRTQPGWDISRPDALENLWPALLTSAHGPVRGVINLAAVSRVVAAQEDPALCWRTNVSAIDTLARALERQSERPWLIFASSREVYGQPTVLPACDSDAVAPLNVYAASKAAGELLVGQYGRRTGALTAILRFSSVYGMTDDHANRVVPAFARSAALGQTIDVHGAETTLDLTHISDVVRAACLLVKRMDEGTPPVQPLLLSTGVGTRLIDLATLAAEFSGGATSVRITAARHYDVTRFFAHAPYAHAFLKWTPQCGVVEGFKGLVDAFRTNAAFCS